MNPEDDRGVLVIVSSPSGAGKTTLTRRLLTEFSNLRFSVSYTTRQMRPGEVDGADYHFITTNRFQAMVEHQEFAEHAFVHGNRYGTARAPIESSLLQGHDLIFDVDWYGGGALSAQWPRDALKIFILPPDLRALANRLRTRATDAPDVIDRRLRKAIEELEHFGEYQHLIINDDVDHAYNVLRALYLTRRYGRIDRVDLPYSLAALASLVDSNLYSDAAAHAQRLIQS